MKENIFEGNLTVEGNLTYDYTQVTGSIYIPKGGKFSQSKNISDTFAKFFEVMK